MLIFDYQFVFLCYEPRSMITTVDFHGGDTVCVHDTAMDQSQCQWSDDKRRQQNHINFCHLHSYCFFPPSTFLHCVTITLLYIGPNTNPSGKLGYDFLNTSLDTDKYNKLNIAIIHVVLRDKRSKRTVFIKPITSQMHEGICRIHWKPKFM